MSDTPAQHETPLPGPIAGDPLLRVDRCLRDRLDGVYRSGEVYLRFFQRLSSLLFATGVGRMLSRTLLLPFGGSVVVLLGLDHILKLVSGIDLGLVFENHRDFQVRWPVVWPAFAALALILLAVINWPTFRAAEARCWRLVWRGVVGALVDFPRWIYLHPLVRRALQHPFTRAFLRFGIKPVLPAVVLALFLPGHYRPGTRMLIVLGVYLGINLVLNSPAGRSWEQALLYWLRVVWARIAGNILGGLFRLITAFFGRVVEDFDRMLYAVDELLRFRAGQRRWTLGAKAVGGVLWFYIAYVARFCINLLLEPQLNPIKHFPVVTVSHKICWATMYWPLSQAFKHLGMGAVRAETTAGVVLFCIPGIFGFLAWELKENWRLFRANRAADLRAVPIGHHGESLARLLRPGIHSGAIPKIFHRLRKAQKRQAQAAVHRCTESLDHLGRAIEQFLKREWIALVNAHPAWGNAPLSLGRVRLGPTSVRAEILCPAYGEPSAQLCVEHRNGWILARLAQAGWTTSLDKESADILALALLGLYKMLGVDVVGEQIESLFSSRPAAYELYRGELTFYFGDAMECQATYNLEEDPMPPRCTGSAPFDLPVLGARQVLLQRTKIEWTLWARAWEPDPQGLGGDAVGAGLGNLRILPVSGHAG